MYLNSAVKVMLREPLYLNQVTVIVVRWWFELQLLSDRISLGIELNENTS